MAVLNGNIAATSVIFHTGLEVQIMSKDQFHREKLYQVTMYQIRTLMKKGLISEEEYRQIDTMFIRKYRPTFGTLFLDCACY